MNRIRKVGNKFQVLLTPSIINNASFEMLLDNWLDEYFRGFYIQEYDTLAEAQCEAFNYPDLDWYKLVLAHTNIYKKTYEIVKEIVRDNAFVGEVEGQIMKPDELKNTMFDRVAIYGDRFTLLYGINDIMGFHIVNPWTRNLAKFSHVLETDPRLNIIDKMVKDGVIHLIGRTDIGTTYEIKLWPSMIAQWARWVNKNKNPNNKNFGVIASNLYTKTVLLQQKIDKSEPLT